MEKDFSPYVSLSLSEREVFHRSSPNKLPFMFNGHHWVKWPPPTRKVGKQESAFLVSDVGCGLYLHGKNKVAFSCCVENQQ